MDSSNKVVNPVREETDGSEIVIRKPLVYCTRIFSLGGFLPWQHTPKMFVVCVLYIVLLETLECWDAYNVFLKFTELMVNLLSTPLTASILYTVLMIKTMKGLNEMKDNMLDDIQTGRLFQNKEEKRLYRKYNRIYVNFDKYIVIYGLFVGYVMYFRPLITLATQPRTDENNVTHPYELPFKVYLFVDYSHNGKVYCLAMIFQSVVPLVGTYHAAAASLLATLTLHICGKLAVLARRIRVSLTEPASEFRHKVKSIVNQHVELIAYSDHLNDMFRHILLVEYLNCTLRFALGIYLVLLSQEVGEAFYDTNWVNVESRQRTLLLLCQMNGQKPMYLSAGKFYSFSLFGFTELMKASMAFVSVLQAKSD
ncbi:uncharacterized protein LOC143174987 isoform X2 [Nomia melanderi]|uniref:uncharacterized protein LOC143174987 isoform X2 n=1 Tax=Nomia melanderi TaxID=2448451 RepID=UPI003FCDE614